MKKKNESLHSLSYVKVFLFVIIIIVFISIGIRAFISYKNRSFTHNTFNVIQISNDQVSVAGIDANNNTTSFLVVENPTNKLKHSTLAVQSIMLGIPLHASVRVGAQEKNILSFYSFNNLLHTALNTGRDIKNISLFDALRLYSEANNKEENSNKISYNNIDDLREHFPDASQNFFRDSLIAAKKTSMQVVNGTGIDGLGGMIAEMYSRAGFNVVSITSEAGVEKSAIYISDESGRGDAEYVQGTYEFPIEMSRDYNIADVTIIVGEDMQLSLSQI